MEATATDGWGQSSRDEAVVTTEPPEIRVLLQAVDLPTYDQISLRLRRGEESCVNLRQGTAPDNPDWCRATLDELRFRADLSGPFEIEVVRLRHGPVDADLFVWLGDGAAARLVAEDRVPSDMGQSYSSLNLRGSWGAGP